MQYPAAISFPPVFRRGRRGLLPPLAVDRAAACQIHGTVYPPRMAAYTVRGRDPRDRAWDAAAVRRLRQHLGLSQEVFAREVNARQQTVSEWETGRYRPRGPSARLLTLIAEGADFPYRADPPGHAAP